jgi:NAD(P)-dependent dehydrogenase (short-subunit alcohol dehydrogenase family)
VQQKTIPKESTVRIVITGASAGIGRAAAIEFGKLGARVALLARGVDGLEGAARDVEAAGGRPLAIPCDVADEAEVETAAALVEQAWGGIDIWVNNAMATIFSPVMDIPPEDLRRVTDVTYLGAVWGTRAALARMLPVNAGHIVQVGSALAYRSIPLQSAYCGAKSALRAFTDSLRSELDRMKSDVRVTHLVLGAFNTPQFDWARTTIPRHPRPVGTVYQPEVAARAIVRAALYPRRERYVGWAAVQAVVGTMFMPGLLDRYLSRKAWNGQFTSEPLDLTAHKDNLHAPLPDDFGAHGPFDREAHARSLQARLHANPRMLAALGAGLLMLLILGIARRR